MNDFLGAPTQTHTNGDGSVLSTYTGKQIADFHAACALLQRDGFQIYSQTAQNGSLFSTYRRDAELFHLYWLNNDATLNVVYSDTAGATLPEAVSPVENGTPVTVTQLKLPKTTDDQNDPENNYWSNGMGYVVRLADGTFLVWDGGHVEQAEQLYNLLVQLNGNSDKNIVIRAWIITHSHGDHYRCLREFSKTYADKVTVQTFMIAALDASVAENTDPNTGETYTYFHSDGFRTDVARFDGAKVCTVHTGMSFAYCGLTLEILFAPDELYIDGAVSDFNNTSIVSRLVGGGDSMLFLGDAMNPVTDRLTAIYGETLQVNQCQVAHHGVDDSSAAFYKSLNATVLWYPCGQSLYDDDARNKEVRQALAASGNYEILLHDANLWQRVWGSTGKATKVTVTWSWN